MATTRLRPQALHHNIIDFIIKLLKFKNIATEVSYNNILIIINKFIKYSHFILYNKIYEIK